MIQESCNLIGQEAQLAIRNQKWQSQMLRSLDDYTVILLESFQRY